MVYQQNFMYNFFVFGVVISNKLLAISITFVVIMYALIIYPDFIPL